MSLGSGWGVQGSIVTNGVSKMCLIYGIMNAESYKLYVNILMTEMLPAAFMLLGQLYLFHHDNIPKHAAKSEK